VQCGRTKACKEAEGKVVELLGRSGDGFDGCEAHVGVAIV